MEKKILRFFVDNMFLEGTTQLPRRFSFRMRIDEPVYDEAYKVWDDNECTLKNRDINWEGHEKLLQLINETAVYCLNQMFEKRDPEQSKTDIKDVLWELHPETEEEFNWKL